MTSVASVVLYSHHPAETIAFYRTLGIPLEDEDHGDGVVHAAGDLDGTHMAVIAAGGDPVAQGWRAAGSTFVGFWVEDLDAIVTALAGGGTVGVEHEQCAWGCRAVLSDPDGRPVEVNHAGHCHPGRRQRIPGKRSKSLS